MSIVSWLNVRVPTLMIRFKRIQNSREFCFSGVSSLSAFPRLVDTFHYRVPRWATAFDFEIHRSKSHVKSVVVYVNVASLLVVLLRSNCWCEFSAVVISLNFVADCTV